MPVLSNTQIERINEESLRVLCETGVRIDDDWLVRFLQDHGCSAAAASRVVRMPREVVDRSLRQCPLFLVTVQGWFSGQPAPVRHFPELSGAFWSFPELSGAFPSFPEPIVALPAVTCDLVTW